jgi:serine/threonine-protein kinase HipA
MPSKPSRAYTEAYVWIWLPGETSPVVAGKLTLDGQTLIFNYGQSYLERANKISIYNPELPLRAGKLPLLPGLIMPGSIRDGAPDSWGRRVLINKKFGKMSATDEVELDECMFLLESGSDRIGALDFQLSPSEYKPRSETNVTLEELIASAERVEKGIPLTAELDLALHHGTPIGGARPKALIEDGAKKYIAKFSSTSDIYSVIKAEFIAMRLAELSGLRVAPVTLAQSSHKDVLLIERFDRVRKEAGYLRKPMVSALTLLGLDEMMGHYASYETLCELIRHRFTDPKKTLKELFGRLVFNILVGNTDDHARNHAAFWDGDKLTLTPAYDICPQTRTGNIANQAMFINGKDKRSQIEICLSAAGHFLLSREQALEIALALTKSIVKHWADVCNQAKVSEVDRNLFAGRQFLNPYVFEDLKDDARPLLELQKKFRS